MGRDYVHEIAGYTEPFFRLQPGPIYYKIAASQANIICTIMCKFGGSPYGIQFEQL